MGGLKDFWSYMITDPNKIQKKKKPVLKKSKKSKNLNASKLENQELANNLEVISEATTSKKLSNGILLFILINSILGSSLFYLPSLGFVSSGPASIIAWIAVFLLAGTIALYIAELMGMLPTSGGTYYFCKRAYSRGTAFMAGWLIWLAGNIGMALNIVAAAEYFIPDQSSTAFLLRIFFSALWIIILNYMAFRGIDAGASMLVAFGMFSILVVLVFILPSFISLPTLFQTGSLTTPIHFEYFKPFFTHAGNLGVFTHLLLSLFLILEAFFGFETITYMANEAKNKKDLPKILFKALAICAVLVILVIITSIATVSHVDYLNNARPWAVQALNTLGQVGQQYVVFGMYLVIIGAAAAWPIASSRLIQAMAKDKLFPSHFAVHHPKYNSPYRAVYFQTIMISLFTWFIFQGYILKWGNPYRTTYLIYVLLSLIVLSLILLAVPKLRHKEPKLNRPFKSPFPKLGPILLVAFFAGLIFNWFLIEKSTAISIINLTISFALLGIPLYFIVEMYYDQKAINKVNEYLSYFTVLFEKFHLASPTYKKVLQKLDDLHGQKSLQGQTIMEYGCGIGTLTKELARRVEENGQVIAIDTSKHNVILTKKRNAKFKQVKVLHDDTLDDFKINLQRKANHFISIGMLSYIQKPNLIINKISNQLKIGATIHIVDYDKFFFFIPNVEWIESEDKLKEIFKRAGINVNVKRKKSLLWTYMIIDGVKIR